MFLASHSEILISSQVWLTLTLSMMRMTLFLTYLLSHIKYTTTTATRPSSVTVLCDWWLGLFDPPTVSTRQNIGSSWENTFPVWRAGHHFWLPTWYHTALWRRRRPWGSLAIYTDAAFVSIGELSIHSCFTSQKSSNKLPPLLFLAFWLDVNA